MVEIANLDSSPDRACMSSGGGGTLHCSKPNIRRLDCGSDDRAAGTEAASLPMQMFAFSLKLLARRQSHMCALKQKSHLVRHIQELHVDIALVQLRGRGAAFLRLEGPQPDVAMPSGEDKSPCFIY